MAVLFPVEESRIVYATLVLKDADVAKMRQWGVSRGDVARGAVMIGSGLV